MQVKQYTRHLIQQLQEFVFTVLYGFNVFLLIFILTISCNYVGEYQNTINHIRSLSQRSFSSRVTVLEDKHKQAQRAQPGQQNGR